MRKARASRFESRRGEPVAVATRAAADDPKRSVNLRMAAGTRQSVGHAAAMLGKTRAGVCDLHRVDATSPS